MVEYSVALAKDVVYHRALSLLVYHNAYDMQKTIKYNITIVSCSILHSFCSALNRSTRT